MSDRIPLALVDEIKPWRVPTGGYITMFSTLPASQP